MDSLWLIGYIVLAIVAIAQAMLVAVNVCEHRRRALVRLHKISSYPPSGRVLVLSPCKGHDRNLEENLRAVLNQDYPDYEVTFIVEAADDAACPVIRRAMAACPQSPARLLVAGRARGCGQKVHNLRVATADLSPEIRHLAFFDSDSRPKPYWVRTAIYKHYRPQIGATTGYRWLVPQKPTTANHLVAAINCNVMAVLGRNSHQFVWGGSWAIRRETFDQLRVREAWDGMLSDDLVASNQLRRAGLTVRFDPACVLTSAIDFSWSGMFDFVARQYRITRHYAFRWWLLALAAATVSNAVWIASLAMLAGAKVAGVVGGWLPGIVLGLLYGLGVYRGWAMQSLGGVYSPANRRELRGVRSWQMWGFPVVGLVQWLGLIASAFGSRVRWRSIDYRLGADGRVIFQRFPAAPDRISDEPAACPPTSDPRSQMSNVECRMSASPRLGVSASPRPSPHAPRPTPHVLNILLWDTRQLDVSKDFAGGFGVGMYRGLGGPRDAVLRWFYRRDRRPAALLFANLAAIFARRGHHVRYVVDQTPRGADLYVFNPSLMTLELERQVIARLRAEEPQARVLVVGTTASVMPEAFADLGVTVLKGEAEQLQGRFEEVLARRGGEIDLGVVEDLDSLPFPDWSPLGPSRFRIGYDFWRFPTALIQASRGCRFKCNYCPYLVLDKGTRFRDPEAVVEEIRYGIRRWGFQSFKFRDPLFGLSRERSYRIIEAIARLPRKIQFSIESRIELLPPESLRLMKRAGLTSVTVGIETPSDATLEGYRRQPIDRDRQHAFIAACRELSIRTVAGFMIGFPEDTEDSIRRVRNYAVELGPTFANFNVVTPYPGTEFFADMRHRLAAIDYRRFSVYTPMLRYDHLTPERIEQLLAKCFRSYYFRWQYLRENAALLWPGLRRWGWAAELGSTAVGPDPPCTSRPRNHAPLAKVS